MTPESSWGLLFFLTVPITLWVLYGRQHRREMEPSQVTRVLGPAPKNYAWAIRRETHDPRRGYVELRYLGRMKDDTGMSVVYSVGVERFTEREIAFAARRCIGMYQKDASWPTK